MVHDEGVQPDSVIHIARVPAIARYYVAQRRATVHSRSTCSMRYRYKVLYTMCSALCKHCTEYLQCAVQYTIMLHREAVLIWPVALREVKVWVLSLVVFIEPGQLLSV